MMLQIQNVSFSYPNQKSNSIKGVSFELYKGQNLAIMGESGCGKSTLLKLIYGLYDLEKGTVLWNHQQVTGPKFNLVPGMSTMKYLAQDFDLMPYITVAENVGKYLSNFFMEEKKNRVAELLEVVEMTSFANVKAKFLSGGQMQRVALAKVLAKEPELLLLDEPFSHIDNFRKNSLRRKIFTYLKEKGITCVMATHDVNDALSFTDKIIVLQNGAVITDDATSNVYNQKDNFYVASLFDEISEIEINGKKKLFYPHEFEIVENSEIKVKVNQSFFKGNYFLIEASFKQSLIYFNSDREQEIGTILYLKEKSRS